MTRLLLLALIIVSSCAPVYVPNVRNSPMFTKSGEFQASIQAGNGFDLQSAYAITDHFGLMTNYSFADRSSYDPDHADNFHQHKLLEGGAGYFTNRDDSFFEVFLGYGRGMGSSFDEFEFFGSQSIFGTGKYERYFIQPAFGINRKEIDVSFVSRFSLVDFYEFSDESISMAVNEDPKLFFEPAIVGRGNFAKNHMFINFQGGLSVPFSENIYFTRRTFQVSLGIGVRFGGKKELINRIE